MSKKISLLELAQSTNFKTTKADTDPETGKISWDVQYYPDFPIIFEDFDKLINDLKEADSMAKIDDPVFNKCIGALKSTRIILHRRITDKFPQLLKKSKD